MNGEVRFRLGDVLPADDEHASVTRFLVLSRQASAMRDVLGRLAKGSAAAERDGAILLVSYYVGALKEFADAFRDLNSQGRLAWVTANSARLPDLAGDVAGAIAATNKADPGSLYCRFLKPVRDDVGFHVSRNAVRAALASLKDEEYQAAEITGVKQHVHRVPLASAVVAHLAWRDAATAADVGTILASAVQLHDLLQNVALDLYFVAVRLGTERDLPAA